MKKESLSIIFVKTLLAVLLFAGMGTIIIGGGYIIGEYYKNGTENSIIKPIDQGTENYYDVLEKKCDGAWCCLQSVKTMRACSFKLVSKSGCQKGFQVNSLWCEGAYDWCEQIEKNTWKNCDQDSDCIEAQAGCCDCKNGGEQTGINKKYLKAWESFWKTKCQNVGCISLFNCKEGSVVCENNQCEFKEEIKNNQSDISNWQTYRNEEFGFEMKYPEDWFVYERSDQNRIYIQTTEGHVSKATIASDFKRIWIGYSFDEFSEQTEDYLKKYPGIKKYDMKNGEILMNVYEYEDIDMGEIMISAYWTKDNNNYLATSASEVGRENAKEQVVILKQILSTFKFID